MPKPVARSLLPMILVLACSALHAQGQPTPAVPTTRGQALYDTHCIACHTAQVHWRDKKLATDWASLKALVARWQATAGQFWSEADIVEVARYLNDVFYRYPQTSDVVVWLAPQATRTVRLAHGLPGCNASASCSVNRP